MTIERCSNLQYHLQSLFTIVIFLLYRLQLGQVFLLLLKATKTAHNETVFKALFITAVETCGSLFSFRREFSHQNYTLHSEGENLSKHAWSSSVPQRSYHAHRDSKFTLPGHCMYKIRGHIFSRERQFYERAVSDLERYMH